MVNEIQSCNAHKSNITMKPTKIRLLFCVLFLINLTISAQVLKAPDRNEGEGPWNQLIIRGAILINGTGAPPFGPVDIVIEGNEIASIKNVGNPGVEINPSRRPELKQGGKEIDAAGMYVLPGQPSTGAGLRPPLRKSARPRRPHRESRPASDRRAASRVGPAR